MYRDAVHARLGPVHAVVGHVSDLKPPGYYVVGLHGMGVEIPGRVAAWLEARLDLRRLRVDVRGIDAEVDAVLADLHRVALTWSTSVDGKNQAEPTEAVALLPWLTVSEAADQLSVSESRVRQLVRARCLPAEQVDRRWRISRTDFEHYRAARAA
jgi:excisionase family DNA binding protein